jgi:hypothetical protein
MYNLLKLNCQIKTVLSGDTNLTEENRHRINPDTPGKAIHDFLTANYKVLLGVLDLLTQSQKVID